MGACVHEHQDGGEKPVISMVLRRPLGTGETRDPKQLIPLLKEVLAELIPRYAKAYPKLSDVSVVTASPWFAASLRTLSSKSEKPVKVSPASIKRIVSEHRKTEHEEAGKKTLEALPVTVVVNGYRTLVKRPVQGTTLAVTLYESIADNLLVETVESAVHASYGKAHLTWHTTPLAYAETLLRISDEDHAAVVDVGAEVTDVFILSHQTVAYVSSIPIGARTIARAVSSAGTGIADSMSRLVMFARGELNAQEMEAMAAALSAGAKEWQQQFFALLSEAGNSVPVPHRVFVVGERDELAWFSQVVNGADMKGQRPLPKLVTSDFFSGLVGYGEGGVFDASLALDALFFHMRTRGIDKSVAVPPVLYSVQ